MQIGNKELDTNPKQELSRPKLINCPICKNQNFQDAFVFQGFQVQSCLACHLQFLNPQPSDQTLETIYDSNYFLGSVTPVVAQEISTLKRSTARLYLDKLESYIGQQRGKLLEIGCGSGDFLLEAALRGYEVTGTDYSSHAIATAQTRLEGYAPQLFVGELGQLNLPSETFEVCVLSDALEHVRNPAELLKEVQLLLKPGGTLLLTVPSLDSWSARLLGKHWMEYKPEHLYYFSKTSIQNLLFSTYFHRALVVPNFKVLTLQYIFAHFDRYQVPLFTPLTRLATKALPSFLLKKPLKIVASGEMVLARKQEISSQRKLSVIMPVYNEANTFKQVIEQLLVKELADLEIEIVIVESNSKDGTREEALKYQGHPRVKLILEDRPQGKGHAVRTGLAQATGDFILIQDADLEYDMNDYEDLLKSLQTATNAFVLGSRHGFGGAWKMRRFTDQPMTAFLLNFGHIFFATLLNVLYGQRMKDPFTMYKVFRRDCLFGLNFECNRFDFDYELVIKLLRKGYKPVEIPVSYQSRSFKEGKKVTIFGDPMTWFRALAKFRFQRLNLLENARATNLADINTVSQEAH